MLTFLINQLTAAELYYLDLDLSVAVGKEGLSEGVTKLESTLSVSKVSGM